MIKKSILVLVFLFFCLSGFCLSTELKKQARLYRQQAYEHQNRGDFKEALVYYMKAVQIDGTYKEAYNDLGVIYEEFGELEKAEKMYLQAIEIDSSYAAPYANLGLVYEKMNKADRAIIYWKKRYRLGRKGEFWTEKAKQHLAQLGVLSGLRREEMEKEAALLSRDLIYKREQERSKLQKEAERHFKLGFSALGKGLYEEAAHEFQEVVNLNPENEKLILEAQKYYKSAQESKVRSSIKIHLENGLNYLEEKDDLSLMQELRKALALIPEIPRE